MDEKSVGVSATTVMPELILVSELFVENMRADAQVKISRVHTNFYSFFGKMRVELVESNFDFQLFLRDVAGKEFSREISCETTLTRIWQLLVQQGRGESGVLLTNGNRNWFYVRDEASVLRAVSVDWSADGWFVSVREQDYSNWHDDRRRVVS